MINSLGKSLKQKTVNSTIQALPLKKNTVCPFHGEPVELEPSFAKPLFHDRVETKHGVGSLFRCTATGPASPSRFRARRANQ